MSDPFLSIASVTRRFASLDRPALDAISAGIETGRVTGLVGPDGAGKTTLIRLIAGLMEPDSGRITIAGLDTIRDQTALSEQIGYMPQRFGLYEDLSVLENLKLYADLKNVPPTERPALFERLLTFTDLKRFTDRLAGKLSGGMKQKLGLACALLSKPRLLLLDEPSVGVDPISRRDLRRMVDDLVDENTAVIWATAYLDEAETCETVLLLNEGRLLFHGGPDDLRRRVDGRTFLLDNVADRRRALSRTLDRPDVIDGVVQGQALRLVLAKDAPAPEAEALAPGARLRAVPPRFEDAFIDALGGGPGGRSALAEATEPRPAPDGPMVEARGLTKRYGAFTAANEISFDIHAGEIFGLLGPNGAGKSTTFKMLCGLTRPTAGSAGVAGLDLARAGSQARARLGYMAQKFSLYGGLTAGQNLAFFAGAYNLSGRRARERIGAMVETFGLKPFLDQPADALPLGFKQRLALACAVMHGPQVLFLDEPTSGVDPLTRREFWTHINGLADKGVTVLVTTHFMDEAEYCDRIALIYRGRTIAAGAPDDLKKEAQSPDLPDPTLEDAFIALIRNFDAAAAEAA